MVLTGSVCPAKEWHGAPQMKTTEYPKSIGRRIVRAFAREFAEAMSSQQGEVFARELAQAFADQQTTIAKHRQNKKVPRRSPASSAAIKIDVADVVRQLSTPEANQALRQFYAWNHRWVALLSERNRRAASDAYDFIDAEMSDAVFVLQQFEFLRTRREEVEAVPGTILDLGVYKGASTRSLANLFPDRTIHGFDSFEGLPEDWSHVLIGSFGEVHGVLPDVPDNVRLYKGWFDETLHPWSLENDGPIALLRVDCDIYSSTKTAFQTLGHLLRPGTWIVFDELIGYYGWRYHEYRAFTEFVAEADVSFEFMAYGLTYTIVRITSIGASTT